DRVAPPRRYPSATEQLERPDQQHQRGGQPQGQAFGPVAEQPMRPGGRRQEQQQPEHQAHGGRLSSVRPMKAVASAPTRCTPAARRSRKRCGEPGAAERQLNSANPISSATVSRVNRPSAAFSQVAAPSATGGGASAQPI